MRPSAATRAGVLLRGGVALLLIWGAAASAVLLARSARPRTAEVVEFLRQHDVPRLSEDEREIAMTEAAARVNQLSYEQMRELRGTRALFAFYRPLSPTEKERFARLVMPVGLRKIIDASRQMPAEERSRFLEEAFFHAVVEFSAANPPIDPRVLEKIEHETLRNYIEDLSPEERRLLGPQPIEQLEGYLRATAGGRH